MYNFEFLYTKKCKPENYAQLPVSAFVSFDLAENFPPTP